MPASPILLLVPYRNKAAVLYSQIPTSASASGDMVVSRAGVSTRVNAQGNIESVAANVPRLNYPLGGVANGCPALLVEPAATNGIRNNSMDGAVTGSPGTLPTGGGWSTLLRGLTLTIVGAGTENGIAYIDIRFSGTATSTNVVELRYESNTQIVASTGQVWTHSVYLKKISEPNPPTNYQLVIYERDSGGNFVTFGSLTIVPTTTIQRFTQTRTLSGATTARVQPALFFNVTNGSTYDFTLRIGYPQMELGSVATSVIPTTTGTVTRNADIVTNNTFVIPNLIGAILTEFDSPTSGTYFLDNIPIPIASGSNKIAISYTPTTLTIYRNGVQVSGSPVTPPGGTAPVIGNVINIGHNNQLYQLGSGIKSFVLYSSTLSAAEASGLTT